MVFEDFLHGFNLFLEKKKVGYYIAKYGHHHSNRHWHQDRLQYGTSGYRWFFQRRSPHTSTGIVKFALLEASTFTDKGINMAPA